LFGDPVAIRRWPSRFVHHIYKSQDLSPNGGVRIIGRMNAQAQERIVLQKLEQSGIPDAAHSQPPITPDAVNNRSCGKLLVRAKIAHGTQSGRVFQFGVARSTLGFRTE